MNEIKEPIAVLGGMAATLQEFDQFPAQFLDTDGCEDIDGLSDKMQSIVAVSAGKSGDDDDDNDNDDFTDTFSEKDAESSLVEEVISNGISAELFSDVNSSVSHDPNFMTNQNEELKNSDLEKWIQSVERSSAFGENCDQTMDGNRHPDVLPISKSSHQKGIAIETQTDWEWVVSAVANQSIQDEKEDEEEEEEVVEESGDEDLGSSEDERPLSFNSTKSSDLISCFTPQGAPEPSSPPCLPNVGPPKILQYCRESEKDNVTPKDIPKENSEVNMISFNPLKNMTGLCEFCQNTTKPLPTLEQESTLSPEELYCCEEYQKFLEMVLQSEMVETRLRLEIQKSERKNLKSVKNPPKGKTLNKKELKNKVKAREMRLKQKQETLQQQQLPPQGYHTTRQMNTINYQLSSRRCLEEGWTVRTPYLEQMDFDGDIFEVEPGKRMALWRGVENISEGPLEKFYDSGHKFFTIFADGTGNIFYPTGQLAILITATQPCHFTYVIYRETTLRRKVAAIFEHTGYGTCYHANGNIRLYIDPSGGVEADEGGAIKRRWQWNQPGRHVHAPPLQPIHVALNKFIGIKLVSQRNIQLNFIAKRRSCKINMGVNVKPVNVMRQSAVTDENQFYLEDKKTNIECLLSKVRNLIQYSHSPKLERILPPIYLTNKASKLQEQAKQVTVTKKRPKVIVRSEISS